MIDFKKIKLAEAKEYIDKAWSDDSELAKYYNNKVKDKKHETMVSDTLSSLKEIKEIDNRTSFFGVYVGEEKAGFIVLNKKMELLYSFGVNKKFRTKNNLSAIFSFIKKTIASSFICFIYNQNERAINWLVKCGMDVQKEFSHEEGITKLKYQPCQY